MAKKELNLDVSDVVWIGGDLYCKTPESWAAAQAKVAAIGYKIVDQRIDGYSIAQGRTTPEEMERDGWSLWYVSLPDIRKAKCGSCHGYISLAGSRVHGHACELCGAVVYREIVEGSTVRFSFVDRDNRDMRSPQLHMKVQRWDLADNGIDGSLYLYKKFAEWGGLSVISGTQAEAYMDLHADRWELVTEDIDGVQIQLYKMYYRRDSYTNLADVIEMQEIHGHEWNYKIVRVWDGVEYPEYLGDMPVAESFSVYETWHWPLLEASPTLHERLLQSIHNHDDKSWHYQDGRPWFARRSWQQIGLFVRHFTTLDADEWDRQSRSFPLDGPGGIDAVAAFCHPLAQPPNEPNIGNLLHAMGETMEGRTITAQEDNAAMAALVFDDRAAEFLTFLSKPCEPISGLPDKIPWRVKRVLRKPLSRRTPGEQNRLRKFLARVR